MRATVLMLTLGCSMIVGTTLVVSAQAQARPTSNLQVLPKEWTTADVQPVMQGVAAALGVQCTYCHERDRSLDVKPQKLVARKMFEMTMHINNEHLKGIGEPPPPGVVKVTCFTCHRGELTPPTVPPSGGL
ncbi:MAG TPA: c-type cytochrome [Vicinamibacterales bacterium]|nr:c-type cytochrome [Vicinamibacterales bacterium]